MPAVQPVSIDDLGEALAAMPPAELAAFLGSCSPEELTLAEEALSALAGEDRYFGPGVRDKQIPPDGQWLIWMLRAGRGWGKTRVGAEWLVEEALSHPGRTYAIVAPTIAAARNICVEGRGADGRPSGVLTVLERRGRRPATWNRSMGELRLENGSLILLRTAEEPEGIRGYSFDGGWCDEMGSWIRPDTFDQLTFALRSGDSRIVITTTPRPTGLIRSLMDRSEAGDTVRVTIGSTWENRDNLAPHALKEMENRYAGTRLGRQELEGELLEDVEGALWRMADILHDAEAKPTFVRIMVGIDPSTWGEDTGGEHNSVGMGLETGMVVVGITDEYPKRCVVLQDLSGRHSPDEWARIAVKAQKHWSRTAPTWIVPETNAGGGMVTATIRLVDPSARIYSENGRAGVHAAKGKRARAEPVAALYEQHRVVHADTFRVLETQMCEWDSSLPWSPDRVDALVWAITALKPWSGAAGIAKAPERRPGKPKPSVRATNLGSPQRVGRPRTRGNSSLR